MFYFSYENNGFERYLVEFMYSHFVIRIYIGQNKKTQARWVQELERKKIHAPPNS